MIYIINMMPTLILYIVISIAIYIELLKLNFLNILKCLVCAELNSITSDSIQ